MELKQLQTFVTIARRGSFTQAAQELGYAQSTITTQIQLFEQELGTRLFERLGRSVALTPAGAKLLEYARPILRLCAEAQRAVAVGENMRGILTIGAVESLCVVRLPELVREYRRRYPEVEIALKIANCADFRELLGENQIDVAFFLDQAIAAPDLVTALQVPEPLTFLAMPGHPLISRAPIGPADLAGASLILTEAGCSYRRALESTLAGAGVKPHSVLETGSLQAIKQFTMDGMGITLLPRIAATAELADGRLVKLDWIGPEFAMLTQLVYHKDKWLSPPLRAFIALAQARMGRDNGAVARRKAGEMAGEIGDSESFASLS
ncbi:LysR family transcriptional regulator [Hydrogenispora ethanolica]|jgi:DNA-binding transcriptional LysR family regulator|uniref:LysR family transcriptional regulator n=1 Tax=Hydrogenispora ethanolica TaxID=1082276 RepID=A0A4R1R933_HYDET|nr:LysR family transcriptional regulator [Hydrogenispora ethanolica]TCL62201.1 LysR family transcriptional regulator [Hydrogenispora ethanolica]